MLVPVAKGMIWRMLIRQGCCALDQAALRSYSALYHLVDLGMTIPQGPWAPSGFSTVAATSSPAGSWWTSRSLCAGPLHEEKKQLASKLLYRSKQRGFLELDLLIGGWAEQKIPGMNMEALEQLQEVLDEENPDLFKWLTGQAPSPDHLLENPVYVAIKEDVGRQLDQTTQGATRAKAGTLWVRGWHDGMSPAGEGAKQS